jgi:hypothetical protein
MAPRAPLLKIICLLCLETTFWRRLLGSLIRREEGRAPPFGRLLPTWQPGFFQARAKLSSCFVLANERR